MADTRIERLSRARTRDVQRSVAQQAIDLRHDLDLSQRAVARAAGIDDGFYSRVEAAQANLTLARLVRIATALGADVSLRLYPSTGPRVHDHLQAPMIETVLSELSGRWRRLLEVPVYRPTRGVIDLVLLDDLLPTAVASEAHSDLPRVERQFRRASEKADALPSASGWPWAASERDVSQLLILRSTATTRALVGAYAETFATAFPVPAEAAVASLRGRDPWPGPALVWVDVRGRSSRLLAGPPRGVEVGRVSVAGSG